MNHCQIKALSWYIYWKENGTVEEIGSLRLPLDGVVNAVLFPQIITSAAVNPRRAASRLIINFNARYITTPLSPLPGSVYQNTSKSTKSNQ